MIVKLARGSYDPADLWVGEAREIEATDAADLIGCSAKWLCEKLDEVEPGDSILFCSTLGQRLEIAL